jgi:hypothetical protein
MSKRKLKIGDILYNKYGSVQVSSYFYEIIGFKFTSFVVIRKLKSIDTVLKNGRGVSIPDIGNFVSKRMTKKYLSSGAVIICEQDHRTAFIWDGKSKEYIL